MYGKWHSLSRQLQVLPLISCGSEQGHSCWTSDADYNYEPLSERTINACNSLSANTHTHTLCPLHVIPVDYYYYSFF